MSTVSLPLESKRCTTGALLVRSVQGMELHSARETEEPNLHSETVCIAVSKLLHAMSTVCTLNSAYKGLRHSSKHTCPMAGFIIVGSI